MIAVGSDRIYFRKPVRGAVDFPFSSLDAARMARTTTELLDDIDGKKAAAERSEPPNS